MKLSIIIPAYNEADMLAETIDQLAKIIANEEFGGIDYEIIVVENGSTDDTWKIAHLYDAARPRVFAIQSLTGKGAAVRRGMLYAHGDVLMMCDADLSMPPSFIPKMLDQMADGHHVVIASRQLGERIGEPVTRHIMGRVFNLAVQALVLPGISDTQCGFKLFTRRAARAIFDNQMMDGFAFDVETLVLARALGFEIAEIGVDWYYHPSSSVRPVRDSVAMFRDVLAIRKRINNGVYDQQIGALAATR
jgi:dolichyl-phosphate beta-glucosyltransferase